MRIDKLLSELGLCTRREAAKIAKSGGIVIDGMTVKDPSKHIDPEKSRITLLGREVVYQKYTYVMLNKPEGYVSATDDRSLPYVTELLPEELQRRELFPVGRLDYDTEGLLLLTTDGDFANLLTHPSACVPKTYVAKVEGAIDEAELNVLRRGVILDGKKTKPAKVQFLGYEGDLTRIEVIISEGRNRQVRRMFEAIGKNVVFLKRTQIGPLRLGGLARGGVRPLTDREIGYFKIKTSK